MKTVGVLVGACFPTCVLMFTHQKKATPSMNFNHLLSSPLPGGRFIALTSLPNTFQAKLGSNKTCSTVHTCYIAITCEGINHVVLKYTHICKPHQW